MAKFPEDMTPKECAGAIRESLRTVLGGAASAAFLRPGFAGKVDIDIDGALSLAVRLAIETSNMGITLCEMPEVIRPDFNLPERLATATLVQRRKEELRLKALQKEAAKEGGTRGDH